MFKIIPDPTFDATLTLIGQGKEQKLNVTFRHKTKSEYQAMFEAKDDDELAANVVSIIEKWDADAPVSVESVKSLLEHQLGAGWAILHGYGEALMVARKGN
ncbi:MAG TPA: phage tail assembly chaperone [Propionibacteriaceae bacterium]|nr:phage tail assembly chaperone [Propionibacteriaceae bacterium]